MLMTKIAYVLFFAIALIIVSSFALAEGNSTSPQKFSCTKSDSDVAGNVDSYGRNLYDKGTVILNNTSYTDFCFISNNRDATLDKINECNGPKCLLSEYLCPTNAWDPIPDGSSQACQYGCSDGACLPRCTDSDNGKNYFVKGYTKGSDIMYKDADVLVRRTTNDKCAKDEYPVGGEQYKRYSTMLHESFCNSEGYYQSETATCDYGCENGACLQESATPTTPGIYPEEPKSLVTEKVNCVFKNSNNENNCYSSDGEVGCSGEGSCSVDVKGIKGKEITWKSSCGGYANTVNDWNDEVAVFDCSAPKTEETVTCYFENSVGEQKCYIAEDNSDLYCVGTDSCSIVVGAPKGEKFTWKSSCGGYQYTFQDWENEKVVFECGNGETTSTSLTGGFKVAYWQCYNDEEKKEGSEGSCKSAGLWKKYAKEFCNDKCSDGKCGVNAFSVADDCYSDDTTDYSEAQQSVGEAKKEDELLNEDVLVCKDSCPLEGKCYQFGYRKEGMYCTDKSSFELQLKGDVACDNNFQCGSNVCVSNKCVSQGLLDQIINWFKRLFGSN